MRGLQIALVVLACAACTTVAQTRRVVRVRQRVLAHPQEEEQQQQQVAQARSAQADDVSYYQVAPESEEYQEQPRPAPVRQQQAYRPRADVQRAIQSGPRTKDTVRAPPVETISSYNTINDDGSFTFGYEAADGSFKEETRGTDCVVRGKYGYIDPEGNKREFTYVSGNPCDPNNPNPAEDDDQSEEEEDSEENVPVRRPVAVRPNVQRARPAPAPAAPATVFQNDYQGRRIQPTPAPVARVPQQSVTIVNPVTPTPVARQNTVAAPIATTYRPPTQNYPTPVTAAPTAARLAPAVSFTPVQPAGAFNFDNELKRFELKQANPTPASRPVTNQIRQLAPVTPTVQSVAYTPAAQPTPAVRAPAQSAQVSRPASNPFYNSQLIFDPASGQYNTALYQQLPNRVGDFAFNTRLQPYVYNNQQFQPSVSSVPQPAPFAHNLQALRAGPSVSPVAPASPVPAAAPSAARYPANVFGGPQQSFYYINPNLRNQYSTGQIDAFLKGHNLNL